jgi:hypothetical protein
VIEAIIGGAGLLSATTLAIILWRETRASRAASDLASEWRRQFDQTQHELELTRMTVKVQAEENQLLKKRLEVTEQQRNRAMETARDHFVQRLQDAKIADAAKFVADMLATPLAGPGSGGSGGGVLPQVPRSENGIDRLIDPDA